jgi:RNA polymerase sigma-70 factor (ECF subfamily)
MWKKKRNEMRDETIKSEDLSPFKVEAHDSAANSALDGAVDEALDDALDGVLDKSTVDSSDVLDRGFDKVTRVSEEDTKEVSGIIKQAIKGNKEAFEILYKRYIKYILYTARTLLDNPNDADDVAQEVILKLYRNIRTLKSPYAFNAYLMRIVRVTCMDWNIKDHSAQTDDISEFEDDLTDETDLPEESAEKQELNEAILRVIKKLPEKQRRTLYLYYYCEMSYKEIAELLGTTTQTVGTNILKAKKALKKMIDTENDPFSDQNMTLRGVAFAPALVQAFDAQVGEHISTEHAEAIVNLIGTQVVTVVQTVGIGLGGSAWIGGVLKGAGVAKVVATAATTAAVVTGGVAAVDYQSDLNNRVVQEAVQEMAWEPSAQIVLVSGAGRAPQRDPIRAEMLTNEGEVGSWSIVDAWGTPIRMGVGSVLTAELVGLAPGTYTIIWSLHHPDGRSVRALRQIVISEPQPAEPAPTAEEDANAGIGSDVAAPRPGSEKLNEDSEPAADAGQTRPGVDQPSQTPSPDATGTVDTGSPSGTALGTGTTAATGAASPAEASTTAPAA